MPRSPPRTLARVLAGRLLTRVEIERAMRPVASLARTRAMPRRRQQRSAVAPAAALGVLRDRRPASASRSPTVTEPGKRVVSIFALQGASWKLVDVYYRTLT